MKIEVIKNNKGKVTNVRPKELTDHEKIQKAIQVMINLDKVERMTKEHKALIPESVQILKYDRAPLEHGKVNVYGYQMYSYTCHVKFRIHREYNPQPNGQWGSHKFVDLEATIHFEDTKDPQIANFQEVRIKDHKYINR